MVPLVLILLSFFSSCNNNRPGVRQQLMIPRESMRYDSNVLSPAFTRMSTLSQNTLSQPFITQTDPRATQALGQTQNNTTLPLDTAAMLLSKGLNPPHGYPGHRCDLKVGEALNLKPEVQTPKQGLNPAHGQPGHRCDIAVGAPLNSKPATNSAQSSTVQSNASAEGIAALKKGLNPAHGQPGHRCDIAVGAPLDSKPLTSIADQSMQLQNGNTGDTITVDSIKN